jgi:hypothetical protein
MCGSTPPPNPSSDRPDRVKRIKVVKRTTSCEFTHRTLRMSPAMAAGVTTRLWDVSDIVELLQGAEAKKAA